MTIMSTAQPLQEHKQGELLAAAEDMSSILAYNTTFNITSVAPWIDPSVNVQNQLLRNTYLINCNCDETELLNLLLTDTNILHAEHSYEPIYMLSTPNDYNPAWDQTIGQWNFTPQRTNAEGAWNELLAEIQPKHKK